MIIHFRSRDMTSLLETLSLYSFGFVGGMRGLFCSYLSWPTWLCSSNHDSQYPKIILFFSNQMISSKDEDVGMFFQ